MRSFFWGEILFKSVMPSICVMCVMYWWSTIKGFYFRLFPFKCQQQLKHKSRRKEARMREIIFILSVMDFSSEIEVGNWFLCCAGCCCWQIMLFIIKDLKKQDRIGLELIWAILRHGQVDFKKYLMHYWNKYLSTLSYNYMMNYMTTILW